MIRLLRRRPSPQPPPRPALMRDLMVVSAGVGFGAILSAVVFLFYAEPLSINENRGRTEFNKLRTDRNEADIKELRAEHRYILDALRTHRH